MMKVKRKVCKFLKTKKKNGEIIFRQQIQEDIRFFYEEIWQKEDHEYDVQEVEQRIQFEDKELWWQYISERIIEEEAIEDRPKLFFRPNTREINKNCSNNK